MAYATTTIPASSIDVDAPMLIFGQALISSPVVRWTLTEDMFGTDVTAPGFPTRRIVDGFWTRPTKPETEAASHYLMCNVDTTRAIDALVVLGHNFKDAPGGGGSITLTARTADNDNFTTNPATIASFAGAITTDARAVMLATANRYTNVERLSLELDVSGDWIPEVSEVFAGRRIQVQHQPLVPYDDQAYASDVRKFRASSGVVQVVKRSTGQRAGQIRFLLQGESERDDLREYFSGSDYGGEPFVLIPRPDTDPQRAYVLQPVDAFSVPMSRPPYAYQHVLEVEEMGPYHAVEIRQ